MMPVRFAQIELVWRDSERRVRAHLEELEGPDVASRAIASMDAMVAGLPSSHRGYLATVRQQDVWPRRGDEKLRTRVDMWTDVRQDDQWDAG